MSWSVNAVGKADKVAEKVATELARYKCVEPEETIKTQVGTAIATALAAFPPGRAVKVEAYGSQNANTAGTTNSLSVRIEPIYGFVE